MSNDKLPDGWRRVKFGDVVRKVNDRVDPDTAGIDRYVAGEHMDTDDLTIRRWGEIGDGYLGPAFHMRFRPGQVLYGSRRTYLRKVAVADFEGITANTTFVVEPSSKNLLPEFLPLLMTTEAFHEHSIKQSKGSVNPYINFSDLTWYEFALPPIDEQRRVTRLIVVVDEGISALDLALTAIEELQESCVSQSLFTNRGADRRVLGDFADVNPSTPGSGVDTPFIRMDAVPVGGRFPQYLEVANGRGGVRALAGDVLLARITPCLENGKICQVPDLDGVVGGSTELLSIRTRGEINQQLLYFWARSKRTRRLAEGKMSGSTGRLRLSAHNLSRLPLEPAGRAELERSLELLELLEDLKSEVRQQRFLKADLRKALLGCLVNPVEGAADV